jgi:hypothetical protein
MTRLEKIVLEQKIRKGNMGVRKIDGPLASRTAKYFTNPDDLVTSFYYVDKHGRGNKYDALTVNELVQRWLPTLFELQKYNTKDYIIILDTDSQVTGNTESVWDVFVANRNSLSKILDTDIKKLGKVGVAPLISLSEFQKLKNQDELKNDPIKKQNFATVTIDPPVGVPVPSVPIDEPPIGAPVNDLTVDETLAEAVDFQRILNNFYIKFDLTETPQYKNFVGASKKFDGSWDGNIGDKTKKAIEYVKAGLVPDYVGNTISDLSKRLEKEINDAVNESVNYFKGDNIQVSLSRLFEQALKEGFDKDKADAWAAADAATKEPTAVPKPKPTTTLKDKAAVDTKPKSAKIVDKLVRQENGFLISKSYLDQLTSKKYPAWSVGKELDAKKLMYGKSFKFRDGIGAVEDNQWRGYQQVNADWIDGNGTIDAGFGSRNISPLYWKNAKKGNTPVRRKKLVQIMDVKFIIGPYYGRPEPKIYTYVYCKVVNLDKGFWVPTTWITLI